MDDGAETASVPFDTAIALHADPTVVSLPPPVLASMMLLAKVMPLIAYSRISLWAAICFIISEISSAPHRQEVCCLSIRQETDHGTMLAGRKVHRVVEAP